LKPEPRCESCFVGGDGFCFDRCVVADNAMKNSTRLYAISIMMAVIQFFDTASLTFGSWALVALVFARLCEGAEELEEHERK
jgi:hypothetical protein